MRCVRALVVTFVVLAALAASGRADAAVLVSVDISTQTMKVRVDGEPRYDWAISTGRLGYRTPNGTYRAQKLVRRWYSRKYGGAMPHSVFFHKGFAIHGTTEVRRLGRPASHGCIRLHPDNAEKLYALIKEASTTRIIISGARPTMVAHSAVRRAKPRTYRASPWRAPRFFGLFWGM
jgi:lipoprotein-anchoring transpeptidase ErfK/SrfK